MNWYSDLALHNELGVRPRLPSSNFSAEGARSTMGKKNWEMHESQKFWLGYDVTSVRPSVRLPLHVIQCEMRHANPILQPAFLLAGTCMANCFLEKQT